MHASSSNDSQETVVDALSGYVRAVGPFGNNGQYGLSGGGPIADFEARLARYYGVRHAVCVSSATTGITSLLLALGLQHSEIVTTPLSYGATVAPLILFDSKIVFADIEPDTLGVDPASVRQSIGPKTRALLAVDTLGNPSDTRSLRNIADSAGIWYLADAAQSLGASRDGCKASCYADALVVSFGPGKTVFGGGEGGAVITDNDEIYERIVWWTQHPSRHLRDLGLDCANEFGMNGRMHGAAAAWANAVFDESLLRLKAHQVRCFRLIELLREVETVDAVDWQSRAIYPTFSEITVAWKGTPQTEKLERCLLERGYAAELGPLPVRLLNETATFVTRAGRRHSHRSRCPIARREFGRRCALRIRSWPH